MSTLTEQSNTLVRVQPSFQPLSMLILFSVGTVVNGLTLLDGLWRGEVSSKERNKFQVARGVDMIVSEVPCSPQTVPEQYLILG